MIDMPAMEQKILERVTIYPLGQETDKKEAKNHGFLFFRFF